MCLLIDYQKVEHFSKFWLCTAAHWIWNETMMMGLKGRLSVLIWGFLQPYLKNSVGLLARYQDNDHKRTEKTSGNILTDNWLGQKPVKRAKGRLIPGLAEHHKGRYQVSANVFGLETSDSYLKRMWKSDDEIWWFNLSSFQFVPYILACKTG